MRVRRLAALFLAAAAVFVLAEAVRVGPVTLARTAYRRALRVADRGNRWLVPTAPTRVRPDRESDRERGFVVFRRSILRRIHPTSVPNSVPNSGLTSTLAGEVPAAIRLQAAQDQYEAAQLGVHALRALEGLRLEVSDLTSADGRVLPASAVDVRMERFYAMALSIRVHNRFGVVPKTLEPAVPVAVAAGSTRPYWLTVHVPERQAGGRYEGTIAVRAGDAVEQVPLRVEVLARKLDEAPMLLGPLSVAILRNYPQARPRRAEVIRRHAESIFADIRAHGMTTLSLWSGRVARHEQDGRLVLPDLDLALDLYRRNAFPQPLLYAPVNLLSTNKLGRSDNYRRYDAAVAVPLAREMAATYTARALELGVPGIVFDPIEEPNYALGLDRRDAPDLRQRMATELLAALKQAGATTAMTCTPQTALLGAGNLDYWLVAYKRFTPGVYERAARAGAHAAMYANATLTGNGTSFSRFFFGYYPWANRLAGMMAWTYPIAPKRFPVNLDPQRAEGALDVREGFLGSDGRPVPTIQWELAREGVDDARYLVTIENLAARVRALGTPRALEAARTADVFLASVRAAVARDPHRYTFEDPHTLEPTRALGWDDSDFAARRRRSFAMLRTLSALAP